MGHVCIVGVAVVIALLLPFEEEVGRELESGLGLMELEAVRDEEAEVNADADADGSSLAGREEGFALRGEPVLELELGPGSKFPAPSLSAQRSGKPGITDAVVVGARGTSSCDAGSGSHSARSSAI